MNNELVHTLVIRQYGILQRIGFSHFDAVIAWAIRNDAMIIDWRLDGEPFFDNEGISGLDIIKQYRDGTLEHYWK